MTFVSVGDSVWRAPTPSNSTSQLERRSKHLGSWAGPSPTQAWLPPLPLAQDPGILTSKAPEVSNAKHVSRKSEGRKAINFDNCFLAELATHCVVMVSCRPDQPGVGEEVHVP